MSSFKSSTPDFMMNTYIVYIVYMCICIYGEHGYAYVSVRRPAEQATGPREARWLSLTKSQAVSTVYSNVAIAC